MAKKKPVHNEPNPLADSLPARPRNRRENPDYVLVQARVRKDLRAAVEKKRLELGHHWSEIIEKALEVYLGSR
jgi:hypothetical protein